MSLDIYSRNKTEVIALQYFTSQKYFTQCPVRGPKAAHGVMYNKVLQLDKNITLPY